MSEITRGQITQAIHGVTGTPASGIVHDLTPELVEAINTLINGQPEPRETRVIQAQETRTTTHK